MRRLGISLVLSVLVSLGGVLSAPHAGALVPPSPPPLPPLPVQVAHGAWASFLLAGGSENVSVVPNPVGVSLGATVHLPVMTWHVTDESPYCSFEGDVDSTGFWVSADLSAASLSVVLQGTCYGFRVAESLHVNWAQAGASQPSLSPVGVAQPATASSSGRTTTSAAIEAGVFTS